MEAENELRTAIQRLREQRALLGEKIAQIDSAIRALCELVGEPLPEATENRLAQTASVTAAGKTATPHFEPRALFGLTQPQAAAEILRRYDRPMTMTEILEALKREKFGFDTQNPFQSLFKAMTRSSETFVKHGKQWGLRNWPGRATQRRLTPNGVQPARIVEESNQPELDGSNDEEGQEQSTQGPKR
jgi:hypothetical protein